MTVDAIVFSARSGMRKVLLVKRKNAPFKDMWVLPGGFVDQKEDLKVAAMRELEEETSLKIETLVQFKAYGNPDRDPRGHTVTVAFLSLINDKELQIEAASDAREVKWFGLNALPALGFDHEKILREAIKHVEQPD